MRRQHPVNRRRDARAACAGSRAHPGARSAFTLVEMIVVLILVAVVISVIYAIFFETQLRAVGVEKRAEGQQAVRLLMMKMRLELKRAFGVVSIDKDQQRITIPLFDRSKSADDPDRIYYSQYEFLPESKNIVVRRLNKDRTQIPGTEQLWLGGNDQIFGFKCYHTGENERILFQYYRVVVEVDHYEVKMRPDPAQEKLSARDRNDLVHITTTVYPRRVNMELRIEVPQDATSGA